MAGNRTITGARVSTWAVVYEDFELHLYSHSKQHAGKKCDA